MNPSNTDGLRAAPSRSSSVESLPAGLPGPALGLRLLALAVVAGSGVFYPSAYPARVSLMGGILTGALFGFGQYLVSRRRIRVPGELFVVAHVAVWTYLARVSGGSQSPLFVGYLLEIPLSALLLSRRGCVLASVAGAAAYLASTALLHAPLDLSTVALAIGFIALIAVLTWLLIGVLERQQRQIRSSESTLRSRAENLAEELRLLGDYLGGALIALDDMGCVVSVNQPGLSLLGIESNAAIGHAWQEVLRPDAAGARAVARTLDEGVAQRGLPMVLDRPGGRPLAVEAELWVAPSAQGRRTFVLIGTQRHETGEGDPLRRLGEAVACVSHQIKNSLHALQGFAQGIEQELRTEEGGSPSTQHFLKALQSLGGLAEDVLAMSGAPRPPDEVVPLSEVIASAVLLNRPAASRVRVVTPEHEVHVRAHRGQLVHALFNLIDNACRVSPPGRDVTVCVGDAGERVYIEILDAGPGMPDGLDKLNGRAPSSNGSGFGLLATRRFLETSGGELTFERNPGGGTRCRVLLSACDAPETRTQEV